MRREAVLMVGRVRAAARHGPVLAAALVMAGGFLVSFSDPASGLSSRAGIAIFDDDGGQAMFPGLQMAPGHSYTECIAVGTTSAVAGDDVRFAAGDVLGDLAQHLRLRVEIGQGGRFGDCTSFSGSTFYDGTLAALGTAGQGAGIATGWQPEVVASRSFRVTASLDSAQAQQGQQAQGRLVWWVVSDLVPSPTSSTTTTRPTTQPTRTTQPTATTGTTGSTGSTATSGSGGSTSPDPSPTPSGGLTTGAPLPSGSSTSGGPTSAPGGTGSGPRPDVVIGSGLSHLTDVLGRIGRAAVAVLVSPEYPLLAVAAALFFLIVQDRIDRRDPKLAAASRRKDNEPDFPDIFAPRGVR